MTDVDRGDEATVMHAGVAQVPSAQLSRMYDERWNGFLKEFGQVSDLKSQWEYKEESHEFVARATANVVFDWSGGPVSIPLAHVTWKGVEPNADERFKDADYDNKFPSFSSFRTTLILPEGEEGLYLSVQPYEVEAGATRYFRTVSRNGNRLETDRGSITLRPYATAAEVQAEQAVMDSFKDLTATMGLKPGYSLSSADRQALSAAPVGNPETALSRGSSLLETGHSAEAIAQFDAAIAGLTSPHAQALALRALAYIALNNLDKARADIAAAEAANPVEPYLFRAKGRLAEIEEDDLEVVLIFTDAIGAWPEDIYALYRRSLAYERMGQSARALADLERIETYQPQDLHAKVQLAAQLFRMGRAQQADEHLGHFTQGLGHPELKVHLFTNIAQAVASNL